MSLKKNSELENLCLERIVKDIVRHALNKAAETDEQTSRYYKLQRFYSDKLLYKVLTSDNKRCLAKSDTIPYRACLDFIFNRFTEVVSIPSADFIEDIMTSLSNNCKDIRMLEFHYRQLISLEFFPRILKSIKNLFILNLSGSLFEDSKMTMRTISESLIHLQFLDLSNTMVNDEDVSVLCGHVSPLSDPFLKCCYIMNCNVNCDLQLRYLNLRFTRVSAVGIACLLTHMLSIEIFVCDEINWICEKISTIVDERCKFNLPAFESKLVELWCPSNPVLLRRCLLSLPYLGFLHLKFSCNQSEVTNDAGDVLVTCMSKYLQTIRLDYHCADQIYGEHFQKFWEEKGPTLRRVVLCKIPGEYLGIRELYVPIKIVSMCPKVVNLYLIGLSVSSVVQKDMFRCVPELPHVEAIGIVMTGDISLVNNAAALLLSRTPNVREVSLHLRTESAILVPVLSKLSCLKKLNLYKPYVTGPVQDFIFSANCVVKLIK